jgi:hypothetical protein
LVFERNKKKTGKIEGALTMNLIKDKKKGYTFEFEQCAKRL